MPPRSLPESLHALEHVLAEAQYAATMAAPFQKDAAGEHLKKLEAVQKKLTDLSSFIRRQAK